MKHQVDPTKTTQVHLKRPPLLFCSPSTPSGTSNSKLPSRIKRNENATHSREKSNYFLSTEENQSQYRVSKPFTDLLQLSHALLHSEILRDVVNRSFAISFSGSQNRTRSLLSEPTSPKFSPLGLVFNNKEGCSALAVRCGVFQVLVMLNPIQTVISPCRESTRISGNATLQIIHQYKTGNTN